MRGAGIARGHGSLFVPRRFEALFSNGAVRENLERKQNSPRALRGGRTPNDIQTLRITSLVPYRLFQGTNLRRPESR